MIARVKQRSTVLGLALLATACGLLDVSDPTVTEESDLANAEGAELMRRYALHQLSRGVGYGALYGGILSDELMVDASVQNVAAGIRSSNELLDRREGLSSVGESLSFGYRNWQQAHIDAREALGQLRAYAPPASASAHIGQMFAVQAYVALGLGELYCAGFPLGKAIVDDRPDFGAPVTTDEALEYAFAYFDSAAVYAADSARILHFAQVGRARALLGLGRFDEAASAATSVPTDFMHLAEFAATNPMELGSSTIYSVADLEGGNGLDYVSAEDPRIQLVYIAMTSDGQTERYASAKYPASDSPIVLASGIEARLIEAEAALRAGNPGWLTMLNDLRAAHITPALDPLGDPGSDVARVDLLIRERAFWLFGTGHRLGDLRRLIAHYGRDAEDVFPSGSYRLGGTYDRATGVPFPIESEARYVPEVTGCLE